jgi:hypothetical protein
MGVDDLWKGAKECLKYGPISDLEGKLVCLYYENFELTELDLLTPQLLFLFQHFFISLQSMHQF